MLDNRPFVHLYKRDYTELSDLYRDAQWWLENGYRPFIHGHSSLECVEYRG